MTKVYAYKIMSGLLVFHLGTGSALAAVNVRGRAVVNTSPVRGANVNVTVTHNDRTASAAGQTNQDGSFEIDVPFHRGHLRRADVDVRVTKGGTSGQKTAQVRLHRNVDIGIVPCVTQTLNVTFTGRMVMLGSGEPIPNMDVLASLQCGPGSSGGVDGRRHATTTSIDGTYTLTVTGVPECPTGRSPSGFIISGFKPPTPDGVQCNSALLPYEGVVNVGDLNCSTP